MSSINFEQDGNGSDRFNGLCYRDLIKFYAPLAVSAVFIQLCHMITNIALGYLSDPDLYISSFSVAKSFAMLFQSPAFMLSVLIMTFVMNEKTFKKARRFTIISFIIMITCQLIVAFTPLSAIILERFYNLQGMLLEKAVISFRFVIFFSMCVFVKCFFMGVALKVRQNKVIAASATVRLLFIIFMTLLMPLWAKHINNDYIPGLILFCSGFIETLVVVVGILLLNKNSGGITQAICLATKQQKIYNDGTDSSYKEMILFSLPILLSVVLDQLVPSVTNSALALAQNNIRTIAAYSIAISVMNVIFAITYEVSNIVICHDSLDGKNSIIIRRFVLTLSLICAVLMLLLGYTIIGDWVLSGLMNASKDTAYMAKLVFKILPFAPAMMIFQNYKRGKLFKIRKTRVLIVEKGISSLLPYILFLIIPLIPWQYSPTVGIATGVLCYTAAGLFTHLMYRYYIRKNPLLKYL